MAFLAPLAPFLAIAGTAVSAVGTLQSGLYSAQVARNNAKVATQNAEYSREVGQEQAAITSMKGAAKGAQIKTGQAASGIDVNTGSAVDVQAGQREVSKLDVDTVLNNAELQAYGYTTQATNYEAQAKQDTAGAIWGAAGDILSGASSVGGKFSQPTGTTGSTWASLSRTDTFGSNGIWG